MSFNDFFPFFLKFFSPTPLFCSKPSNDTCPVSSQIEQQSLDFYIKSLRVKVQRVKRQKLRESVKQIKHDRTGITPLLSQTLHENTVTRTGSDYEKGLRHRDNAPDITLLQRILPIAPITYNNCSPCVDTDGGTFQCMNTCGP